MIIIYIIQDVTLGIVIALPHPSNTYISIYKSYSLRLMSLISVFASLMLYPVLTFEAFCPIISTMSDNIPDCNPSPTFCPTLPVLPIDPILTPHRLDVAAALKLRINHNLPFEEIGERLGGFSKQCVQQALKRFEAFIDDVPALPAFRLHEADILDTAKLRLIESCVDNEAIAKGSLNNRAYALRQIHDISQQVKGLSTQQAGLTIDIRVCAGAGDRPQSQQVINVTPTQVETSAVPDIQDIVSE